jgi:hypothetical protein
MASMNNEIPLLYGVWIPSHGWQRGDNNKALMFLDKRVANECAKRLGNHARVYYIDNSLVDIEHHLLEAERNDFFYPFFLFDIRRLARFFTAKGNNDNPKRI